MFLLTYLKPLMQSVIPYTILLKKLKLYGVTDRNHSGFKNYLSNGKQFIQINNEGSTQLEIVTYATIFNVCK